MRRVRYEDIRPQPGLKIELLCASKADRIRGETFKVTVEAFSQNFWNNIGKAEQGKTVNFDGLSFLLDDHDYLSNEEWRPVTWMIVTHSVFDESLDNLGTDLFNRDWRNWTPVTQEAADLATALTDLDVTRAALDAVEVPSYTGQNSNESYRVEEQERFNRACNNINALLNRRISEIVERKLRQHGLANPSSSDSSFFGG